MNTDDWEKIKALFNAAVDLEPSARAGWLTEHCADTRIRRQVSLMLQADEHEDEFTEIVSDAASESFGQEVRPGDLVGNWRIVNEIDRGGMGAVFLAERADAEYQQRAALKIVSVALAGSHAVARFRSERQFLAKLQHPNIGQLLDGGTTPSGVPYLVMEYVDGERIDKYCDRCRLGTDERLALFQQVCSAVHVAHQNLIVHRDIKPGNILVTADGVPKLLDFGIAKLIAPDADDDAQALTQANMRLLTPEYASPEQVLGRPITTATDIYSLGVLLYQLLAGRAPYVLSDYGPESLARAICDTDPQRPSTAVATIPADEQIFSLRRTTPAALRKRLRGDLDNIVLMAMRKEPERRYPSALRLSEDIDNCLRDRPVIARKDTLGYRVTKYLRRNAAPVATSAAALVALVALVSFYTLRLSEERDRARTEAVKATQTAEFLQNLFSFVDPEVAQGNDVTARSLLDQGVRQLDVTLTDQPDVRASLQGTIGRVYRSLGLFDEAEPLYAEALATLSGGDGRNDAAVITILLQMAELANDRADFERAVELNDRALALGRRVHGDRHRQIATALRVRATILTDQGDYEPARDTLLAARDMFEDLGDQESPEYARCLTELALVYDNLGEFDASLALLERALALNRQVHGDVHPVTVAAQHALAVAQDRFLRYDQAEVNFREALDNTLRLYGEVHPRTGEVQANMGRLYSHMGQLDEARTYLEAALETSRRVYGERHHSFAYDMVALAKSSAVALDYTSAERYFREALSIYEESLPGDHPYKAAAAVSFGRMLVDTGRHAEALPIVARGREISARALDENHWLTAQLDVIRGVAYMGAGDDERAGALLTGGFERLRSASGLEHGATQYALDRVLEYLERVGDRDAYERYLLFRAGE